LWALSQGIAQAQRLAPEYLLLTDADIVHGRDSVAELVAIAEANQYDLTSYMVKLACQSFAEKALIPAFVFFFLKLYPPTWIASRRFRTAAAAGGCILIRCRELSREIGGVAAIRSEVIDDCALAREVKRSGGRIWMGPHIRATESIRSYGTFREIEGMIARTAFNQLRHSLLLLLIGTVAGLIFAYCASGAAARDRQAAGHDVGCLWRGLLMSVAYLPTVRFYKTIPGVESVSAARRLLSIWQRPFIRHFQYWRGLGGAWKGRVQDARL
jgi:hopene-associated glycosyltransferase HpnB